jgi:DNA-binding MarR family transcriptional regulator
VLPATAEEIASLLHDVTRAIGRRMGQQFKGSPLPPSTGFVLHVVHQRPGLTVSELARAAGQAKSRVSVLVDQLAGEGLLEKRPDPEDRRLVRVHPGPRLAEWWQGLHRMMDQLMAELLADLSPAEQSGLVTALRRLRDAAQRKGWWQP